jgi:peptidoglycan/LPS O-acetylase OafA/YrhL
LEANTGGATDDTQIRHRNGARPIREPSFERRVYYGVSLTERHPDATQPYRADLDGLRAVAVLAVVGYHFFPVYFPSGFIGVDVFFVISGFLISRNIGAALTAGRFSFADFYGRRIRRIFPALLTVLVAAYAIGWAFFFANEFEQLGKHTAAGAAFVANLVFYDESGYFDTSRARKPLLHLWSLGIEEQFYIAWPALLWLTWKITHKWTSALIVTGAASFIFCVAVTFRSESAAFYLPLTRVWEFTFGAWLGLTGTPRWRATARQREGAVALGLLAIAAMTLMAIDSQRFPGWLAAIPVIAATLIVAGGPETTLSRMLLAHPLFVWIGLVSYPLYLWHWPLLAFAKIFDGPLPSRTLRLTLLAVSVILAWLTFRFIERPLRQPRHTARNTAALLAGMMVVAALGYVTYASGGLPSRAVARATQPYVASLQSTTRPSCVDNTDERPSDNWPCHLNPSGTAARTLVVGDSHALALMPAFERVAIDRGEDVLLAGALGCPPLLGIAVQRNDQMARDCLRGNARVFQYVIEHGIADVFLVASWSYYTYGVGYDREYVHLLTTGSSPPTVAASRAAFERGLDDTLARYRAAGVRVHIVQKVPTQLRPATELIRAIATAGSEPAAAIRAVSVPLEDHRRMMAYVRAEFARRDIRPDVRQPAALLDLDAAYCDGVVCPFAEPNVSYYVDSHHLSISGARRAIPLIAERFAAIDARRKSQAQTAEEPTGAREPVVK